MKNGDKVRSLSDEELAAFIYRVFNYPCDACCNNEKFCRMCNDPEPDCKAHFYSWLKDEEGWNGD